MEKRINWFFSLKIAIVSALGGFLFGYDTGIIGSASLFLYDDLGHEETIIQELVVSMAVAGAAVGAFVGGLVSDQIGRKKALIVADAFFVFGAALMGFSQTILMMVFGRFIVGIGIGVAAMGVPVYLAECSPH